MPLSCKPTTNIFDVAQMFERMKTTGFPIPQSSNFSIDEVIELLSIMRNDKGDIIEHDEATKKYTVFGTSGFDRMSSIGFNENKGKVTKKEIKDRNSKPLAAGTAFHDIVGRVFEHFMTNPVTKDIDYILQLVKKQIPDTGILVPAQNDNYSDITIFFDGKSAEGIADYILYLIEDIEQRVGVVFSQIDPTNPTDNKGYKLEDVLFYPEQLTADYKLNRAGHQDLLVLLPNKKAFVYDHKTSLRMNPTSTAGPRSKAFYKPQIQNYMRGNKAMGIDTVAGFLMPVLLDPVSVDEPGQVRIKSVFSSAFNTRKSSPDSYKPIAVSPDVETDDVLSKATSDLARIIASMKKIDFPSTRKKPNTMSDEQFESIMILVKKWRAKYRTRLTAYKELYQALSLNYDMSLINQIYLMLEDNLTEIENEAINVMNQISDVGSDYYMDYIFEIQELLRTLSSIKLELDGISSFYNTSVQDSLSDMASNWDMGIVQNSFGNFLFNSYESPFRKTSPAPVMVLYFNPNATEEDQAWYSINEASNVDPEILDTFIKYRIELREEIMFSKPLAKTAGFFNQNPITDVFTFNEDLLLDSKFYRYLLSPPDGIPYMTTDSTLATHDPKNVGLPFNGREIEPLTFFNGLVEATMQYVQNGDDYFKDLQHKTENLMHELIIKAVSRSYIRFNQDDPKKAQIIFRGMNITEEYLTSAELINHPLYILRTDLTENVNYFVMQNAKERMTQVNQVMKNFKAWYKNQNLGEVKATDLLVDRNKGIFHRKYTNDFLEAIDTAFLNEDDLFFFRHFDVDFDAYNEWIDEARESAKLRYANNPVLMQDWEEKHSFEVNDRTGELGQAWKTKSMFKFLRVKESVFDSVATPEYLKIKNTPELLAVYELFLELTKEANRVIGDNVSHVTAEEAFLPMYMSDFSEQIMNIYSSGNGFASTGDMFSSFAESIVDGARTSPVDEIAGPTIFSDVSNPQILFSGYYPLVSTNARNLRDMTDEERRLNAEKMSYALHSVATAFVYSLYTYEQLKLTEPVALSIRNLIMSDRYLEEISVKDTDISDAMGQTVAVPGRTGNQVRKFSRRLEEFIFYDWYGIRYLSSRREDNDSALTKAKLGKGKGPMTFKSFLLFTKNMYSRNVLGVAVIPSIAALSAGIVAAHVNSGEQLLFDEKGFKNGLKGQLTSSNHRARIRNIGMRLNVYTSPTKEIEENANKSLGKKFFSDWYLYGPLRTADFWISDILLSAILDFHGFDENYNIKPLNSLPEGTPSLNSYFTYDENTDDVIMDPILENPKIFGQIRNRIYNATRSTFGQLPENQKIGLQFNFFSTLALTFSSWMPGIVNKRFKAPVFDPRLDAVDIGRYRGIAQALGTKERATFTLKGVLEIIKNSLKFLISVAPFTSNMEVNDQRITRLAQKWADNNPREVAPIIANASNKIEADAKIKEYYKKAIERAVQSMAIELRYIILIYMASFLARLDYDDDDEPLYKEYWASRQLFKILSKTHSEIIFLLNPKEIVRFLNQPIPAFGIFKDAYKLIENTGDEAIDFITGRDDARDQAPVGYYLSRFLFLNQIRKVVELYDQDKENPYD